MALPIVFLLGLLVVVGHREFGGTLPGAAAGADVLWAGLLLPVPALLALLASFGARSELLNGRLALIPPAALLRLSMLATPAVLLAWFEFGAWSDQVDAITDWNWQRTLLTLLPLFAVELPRLPAAAMARALIEVRQGARVLIPRHPSVLPGWVELWPLVRLQLGWPLLVLLPATLFGLGMDLLEAQRSVFVIVVGTSFGTAFGLLALLLLLAALLPFWFRVAFGARRLRTPMAPHLYELAQRLGFPPHRVLELPTGMRAVNAMMVGPLPIGRHLCLTDALLAMLDEHAVAGVMAHEIGHARRGHPGLLAAIALGLALLMLTPLRTVDTEDLDPVLQVIVALSLAGAVWLVVRTVAHRFEHEADVESVCQLGAGPCSAALETVMRGTGAAPRSGLGRLFTLHPDEHDRRVLMANYELDPRFRERFDRGGRRLRVGIAALLVAALASGAWAWTVDWPLERVVVRYYTGDLLGARAALQQTGDVPSSWQRGMTHLSEEVEAGVALLDGALPLPWKQLHERLAPAAWQRAETELIAFGPAAARRWFALALMTEPAPSRLQLAIEAYCAAAADNDPDRTAALAAIVRRLGVPPSLSAVFAE
ncbi:MAG: M48 family metalloprotease [Planctomycetota bacterium]